MRRNLKVSTFKNILFVHNNTKIICEVITMKYDKAFSYIKQNRRKIKRINTLDSINYKFINEIINNDGKYNFKIADIKYKNNITKPINFDINIDLSYTNDFNELTNDVVGLIYHKASLLVAAFTEDTNDIVRLTTHQDVLNEIEEIENL